MPKNWFKIIQVLTMITIEIILYHITNSYNIIHVILYSLVDKTTKIKQKK